MKNASTMSSYCSGRLFERMTFETKRQFIEYLSIKLKHDVSKSKEGDIKLKNGFIESSLSSRGCLKLTFCVLDLSCST